MSRVHVICRDHTSERIIPRLAAALVAGTGWSVGPKIDPRADVCLAFPYLELPVKPPRASSLLAAEFSHRETTVPAKAAHWDVVATAVDLRLTWARLYADMLAPHGPTRTVTPPLDRDKFRPAPEPSPRSRTVGVSGYVYGGGRKGEGLVKRLDADAGLLDLRLVATGEGWPCPIVKHTWADLHEFYWHIDVYLCTSLIEGIPYPPLEALSSGVPVVVPVGVGMMDELPDVPGIHRYVAGDYLSMTAALSAALITDHDPGQLRAVTERFTLDAWIADHQAAVASLFSSPSPGPQPRAQPAPVRPLRSRTPAAAPLSASSAGALPSNPPVPHGDTPPAWRGRAGVYYVAYGEPARQCAVRAIASLKRVHPDLPCCLVSDRPLGAGEDVFAQQPDSDIGGRGVKTRLYDLAPAEWEYVLYVDADTEVVAPLDGLFDILADGWDVVFCPNPPKYARAADMRRPDNGDELDETFAAIGTDELLQFNGGVFGFRRNERTAAFCRGWHTEWQRWGKRDQAALDRVLYGAPLRVWVLSTHWNRVDRYEDADERTAIVHHPTEARRHSGVIASRLDSDEAWMAVGVRDGGRRR